MNNSQRNLSILSYITIIGWLISYLQLENNRGELIVFHLRQSIGLHIMLALNTLIVLKMSTWMYSILGFGLMILWIFGLITALREEYKPIPFIGNDFQKWFRFIQ